MHPRGRISTNWSDELAYVVGLIATDGSLSKDGRHIDITSKDQDLLSTVKQCLNLQNKIGTKKNGSRRQIHYRIQIGDVLFYRWLQNIGLHPNKSKTLAALKIPDEFFAPFLRGCFDGDGSIWSFWDKRWNNSYIFYLTFTAASPEFLRWLQYKNMALLSAKGSITASHRIEQLRYGKRSARTLYGAMYAHSDVPHLIRKKQRLIEIFSQDPYAIEA